MSSEAGYMRVEDVRRYLNVSRTLAYKLCNGTRIPVYRIGKVILTTKSEVDQYLKSEVDQDLKSEVDQDLKGNESKDIM